ncbi:LysR family transcriptional regulator [Pantoea brenneri]|uniref:LysR family transcriptional regulator n=1 Tax=Pantoea brenneri TaxID=472694 RepID=UPI00289DCF53|nr:LysR family transcriptional regulator [Pantoea brenneri]
MEINSINDIAAFVAAVKAGSYTHAAGSLGITRSAIGKSIVRLETRMGVRLLNRTTRSLSLTDEGRVMFDRCRQILDDLDEIDAAMAMRRIQPAGTLRLSAPLSFGQRHILPLLDIYLKKWPELRAEVSFSDRFVDLIEEGFDIAVRIGEPRDDSRILTRTIATQKIVTSASPEYLSSRGEPETPQALIEHDTIFLLSAEKRRSWRFETPQGTFIYEGPGRLNLDSSEAIRASALSGFGIVHLPTYLIGEDLRKGRLIPILQDYPFTAEPIRLIYPSKRHLSPRIRAFIDLLVERWQQQLPWE